jgi:hypothetical protein
MLQSLIYQIVINIKGKKCLYYLVDRMSDVYWVCDFIDYKFRRKWRKDSFGLNTPISRKELFCMRLKLCYKEQIQSFKFSCATI